MVLKVSDYFILTPTLCSARGALSTVHPHRRKLGLRQVSKSCIADNPLSSPEHVLTSVGSSCAGAWGRTGSGITRAEV